MGTRWVVGLLMVLGGAAAADEIALFNGKDLTGWDFSLSDKNAKKEDVWSVKDGAIVCKGKPSGYIITQDEYSDYVLTLEWRWPAAAKGLNSGVLLHSSLPHAIGPWPKSVEAQLASGNAGDIWVIGTTVEVDDAASRTKGRQTINLTDGSEKPIGQWNRYEITCKGDTITLKVNGDLVNQCRKASVQKGKISLQSEGAEIHFRNIRLQKL